MANIIKFRPHHFLCVLTYIGKGYSQNFTDNFDALVDQLNSGINKIQLVSGPDDICTPRLCDKNDICHCYDAQMTQTDIRALNDLRHLKSFENIQIGSVITLTQDIIKDMRQAYKANAIRTACKDCEWFDICTDISQNNFNGAKLK